MKSPRLSLWLAAFLSLLLVCPLTAQDGGWRTIEFETTEVTAPDVAIAPDGNWLVFTMLGHLFRLPVGGGEAEQLTFGAFQHSDPVFSPDGSRVAFVSNRDGSDGNVFVLDLATGVVTQVTHERWAGRPAWSTDGTEIAYLSFLSRGHHCPAGMSRLRRIFLDTRETETIAIPHDTIRSVFYLPTGNLGWTVHERGTASDHSDDRTHMQELVAPDSVRTIQTVQAFADRAVPHPTDTGFFLRAREPGFGPEFLSFARPRGAGKLDITSLSPQYCFYGSGAFAFEPDERAVYVGDIGRLWKLSLADTTRVPVHFRARVQLEVRDPTPPPTIAFTAPGTRSTVRSVQTPVLSPDARSLVFGAAGHVWRQPLDGHPVRRLLDSDGYEWDPVFSPEGSRLLFVWSDGWRQELRLLEFETNRVEVLATGASYWDPAWSLDGQRVVFAEAGQGWDPHLTVLEVADSTVVHLAVAGLDEWSTHPQFSSDGHSLYYAASPTGVSAIYRVPLDGGVKPAKVAQLEGHLHEPAVSPDGRWLAFRHNTEIWLAPLEQGLIVDSSARRLSEEGGDGFAFTPDSRAITYSTGNQVWRRPLSDGEREEIPITLRLAHPVPAPLLLQDVRLLDFSSGDFGSETTVLIENGRIRQIGNDGGQSLPSDMVTLDAGGRFAIPGLYDMHAHIQRAFHGAWLAYGVTSLRDMGGPLGWIAALADRGDAFAAPLPRLFFAGDILHGVSSTRDPIMISDASQARAYVRQWKARGVDFIKTHPGLTWGAQQALVDEAHRLGLPVVEHGYPLDNLLRSVTVGSTFLEHNYAGLRYYDDVFQLLAASGTHWTPTLATTVAPAVFAREDPEHWVDDKFRTFAPATAVKEMLRYGMLDDMRVLQGYWRAHRNELREAWALGVNLHLGTDAPAWLAVPGASLHQELAAFVDAGLSPLAALRMATESAAIALGAGDELGTLEAGKLADIVLLDANPLEDIRHARRIWRVIKGGWVFDPEKLRPPDSLE